MLKEPQVAWVLDHYQQVYTLGSAALALLASPRRPRRALAAWGAAMALGALVDPCINPRSQALGPVLWKGQGQEKRVALTFDDGPWPPYTQEILDVLAREEVRATFFVVGRQVRRHRDLLRRIAGEGHLVGNHTEHHLNLLLCSPRRARQEILWGAHTIAEVLGQSPRWWRPPYGFRTPWALLAARQHGMSAALWSACPHDYMRPEARVMVRRVLAQAHPGAIVLLHDGNGDRSQTARALPAMIAGLRQQGYRFVDLDEMLSGHPLPPHP
jgi:chitin deacetylase